MFVSYFLYFELSIYTCTSFPFRFNTIKMASKKIIVRYKKIGYTCNINVMRQTACLVVNQIKVNSFAYLFNCTTVARTLD